MSLISTKALKKFHCIGTEELHHSMPDNKSTYVSY